MLRSEYLTTSALSTELMRNPGLEPGSLAALEPESSASANSASSACGVHIDNFLLLLNYLSLSTLPGKILQAIC